jgi:hypothetical protein
MVVGIADQHVEHHALVQLAQARLRIGEAGTNDVGTRERTWTGSPSRASSVPTVRRRSCGDTVGNFSSTMSRAMARVTASGEIAFLGPSGEGKTKGLSLALTANALRNSAAAIGHSGSLCNRPF